MKVTAYQTPLITKDDTLFDVITEAIPQLPERSIVVVASKVVSTCENRFVPRPANESEVDKSFKHQLAQQEADYFMPPQTSKFNIMLTIKRNWIFANSGIDESNAGNDYILWPSDPQKSVNDIWNFLRQHYGVQEVGVTMSDSGSIPLNWGVTGHSIAYCGFNPLKSYIGKPDLFGRLMKMEQVNVAQSVTAAAVFDMGEGNESRPLAVISDLPDVEFLDHEPTELELEATKIELEDDVFAPILKTAPWQKGGGGKNT